jgi:SNF2 family DNA or RNA helicase
VTSTKIETLLALLDEIVDEGHKALVFSQFTSFLRYVKEGLDEKGIRYTYLDGRTRKRSEKVKEFQEDPDCKVFVISLKAGGQGLNLTAADYVFVLDPWWNPAVESQAIDRAHRIGQTRPVMAYRLLCQDTVEERIQELQGRKKRLAEALVTEDDRLVRNLTMADLELLLG